MVYGYPLSLVICLIGGIVYLFLPDEYRTEKRSIRLAEIMFAIGLFVYLFK